MQCISEAERYSAKGFVAKPEKNKGAQKQEMWTECIQELSERPSFDKNTRNVLQRIAGQSNVPRKKPKFVNFLKSSMRYSPVQAEKIWTIIEEGLEEFKKRSAPESTQPSVSQRNESAAETKEDATEFEPSSNGNSTGVSVESIISHAINKPDVAKGTKKALKKLQKRTDIPLNVHSPPKKKKFIKYLQDELELDAECSYAVWECISQSIESLSSQVNGTTTESNEVAGKKRKNTDNDEGSASKKPNTELSMADSTTDANGESTFDWQKHIIRIFNKSQVNNQLPVNSLKSKVIKKFLKAVGEDDSNSAQYDKKFKKILKKINQFNITGDLVTMTA